MLDRISAFKSLKEHIWYSKLFKRLRNAEIEWCESFIVQNSHLDIGCFEQAANRIYIDQPIKPNNVHLMAELLLVANGMTHE